MKIRNLQNLQTKGVTTAALILGISSMVSAVLGLLRDRLLAGRFGAGDDLDIYYAAFRIPDFVSMVLIMGSISAALVPMFGDRLTKNREEAWRFFSNVFNIIISFLIGACVLLAIFTPQLMSLITPGFSPEKKEMVVLLTRIMFLSPILLGTSNIISSVLQVFGRFFITSLCPVLYNLGIIVGIIWFVPALGLQGLAWGVVFGALLHLLVQISVLFKVGFKHERIFRPFDPGFKKMALLTIPRSIGLAASQINFIVVTAIASTLASGGLAVFSLSESLSRPFLILTGVSFSTAAFPQLALAFSTEKKEKFLHIFSETFRKIILLIVPASVILFLFRDSIVSIILKAGKFSVADSTLVAASLAMFSVGLFARALDLFLTRAFYALGDTKTPAKTSVVAMILNVIFCYLFIWLLSFDNVFYNFCVSFFGLSSFSDIRIIGLPLAMAFSAISQFIALYFLFKKRVSKLNGQH
jgi:putative peptidoglycan lipid II flippase